MKHIQCLIVACIALAALTPISGFAQQPSRSCSCEVTPGRQAQYDRELWLNKKDKALAIQTHLPWGEPVNPVGATNERTLIQREYVISYDDDLLVPTWTAHRLTHQDLKKRSRLECFRNDQRLPDKVAAFCPDYDEPIFDRGHMVPNGDMTRSERAMINTYMFSNMTPQHCAFNRGIWQMLEELVRHWAETKEKIYIITGAVFDRDQDQARDADDAAQRMRSRNKKERVAVPSHLYKILLHQRDDGTMETLSLMIPNISKKVSADDAPAYLEENLISIEDIEKVTGLTFFPSAMQSAPDTTKAVKQHKATALWPITRKWPSSLDSNCKD